MWQFCRRLCWLREHVSNHNNNFSRLCLSRTVKPKVSWGYSPAQIPPPLLVLSLHFLPFFFLGWCVGAQEQTSASARFCRCVKGTFKCAIMMQSNAVQNDTSLHPSLGRAISTHARGHAGRRGRGGEIIIPKNVHADYVSISIYY
jgi:hypothetical protein